MGRAPFKSGPKQKKSTCEQRMRKVGWVPDKPGQKQKERTQESKGCGGSQLKWNQNKKKEHLRTEKEEGGLGPR